MKVVKYILSALFLAITIVVDAQQLRKEAFELLNLDYPGLEKVKTAYSQQKWNEAVQELLNYYRNRTNIIHPDVDLKNLTLSKEEQKWADDALEHTFFVHKGYQPSYNYGKDINWEYWPVKDNELRWQLHRHKWFTPMGKAYRMSGDEKYAKEWAFQYLDWIKKNPLTQVKKEEFELVSAGEIRDNADNVRFAWRPLEVSNRLQDQTGQFLLFCTSKAFTPEFLTEFLVNYHRHGEFILGNYSDQGNHLLFEAQRMLAAGAFFPEFKEAAAWRKSGIDILNREIKVQVYPDGGQFELDLHYHLACIEIFCKALRMADVNGFRNEFPAHYINTIESMIMFYMNVCYPDYTNPCFSDAKRGDPQTEQANYKEWLKLFPENIQIRYFATNGQEGEAPANLSKGFLKSGFFAFRNGWKKDATVMVVKAGPKGEWHCQPDNGTFELWFNGKNLFPDSGSYIYAGGAEVMKLRNWFRQTAVHNTLTLDNKNLETTESVAKLWKPEGDVQILVTENPSYKGLKHRRSVFFVNRQYFVIVDEAIGNATGNVNLHYQLCDGDIDIDAKTFSLSSDFAGESQVKLQCFVPKKTTLKKEEGWYSVAYRQRTERTAVSFNTEKKEKENVQFVTVIYPAKSTKDFPKMEAKIKNNSSDAMEVEVSLNGKKQTLKYQL